MKVPLYVISKSDGIPIPNGNTFMLDVPLEHKHLFKTALYPPVTDVWEIDENTEDVVALALTATSDPYELIHLYDQLVSYIHPIGVLCSVENITQTDKFLLISLNVKERIYIKEIYLDNSVTSGQTIQVELLKVNEEFLPDEEDMIEDLNHLLKIVVENSNIFNPAMTRKIQEADDVTVKMDILADQMLKSDNDRLQYLVSESHMDRFDLVVNKIRAHVQEPTKKERQRRRSIIKQSDTKRKANLSLQERFIETPLPHDVRASVQREVTKLDQLQKGSSEHSMVCDYLTWILELPWGELSRRDFEPVELLERLNETHYGLDDIKQHVLEHVTIETVRGNNSGTVLCFVGPPGTGKTSIAKEIAGVQGRKLISIALGGLTDEAEIRGHRRTYIGSRPGRFITGLKSCGAMDPLFLLDEVDKINQSWKGDPTSALLELLDQEQNNAFIDRYLEVPIDLSKAMFICTANYEDQIPPPLKDRMEMLHFRNYKPDERIVIATNYLLPKAIEDYKLADYPVAFEDSAINEICKTEEIRQIEKRIRKLLRMATVDILVHKKDSVTITDQYVHKTDELYKASNPKTLIGFR